MDDSRKSLLDRAGRTFQQTPVAGVLQRVRAIVGPRNMPANEEGNLAQEALRTLENGQDPTPRQLAALELIIRLMRPAPLSRNGMIDDLPAEMEPAFADWKDFQREVKPYLYSVGRIDAVPDQGVGTGFLISDSVLATNCHVLAFLSKGTNVLERGQAVVRFKHEYQTLPDEDPIDITGVIAMEASLDVALLKIDSQRLTDGRRPLVLDLKPVSVGEAVVAVGYPYDDSKRNPMFINGIFGGKFGVKRAAPGEVIGLAPQTIHHDCSTLGGNSGSPLLSMKTARLVGLHRDGFFVYKNQAVDGGALAAFFAPHLN